MLPRLYRRRRPLPERLLSSEQVKRWLAGFDRVGPDGLRSYAMALCLADLGIRTGDVAALRMEDIDWRKGAIRIPNSKTGRSFWLPLPSRTGKAIARYLRHGRPHSVRREVFVRHKTPLNEPLTSVMIDRQMRQVAKKQGIPWFGTYVLASYCGHPDAIWRREPERDRRCLGARRSEFHRDLCQDRHF